MRDFVLKKISVTTKLFLKKFGRFDYFLYICRHIIYELRNIY